jgi:pyruvate-ferredoxin/flavodoxin oxidoreductase
MLKYQDGASVMVVYTPCGTENGAPEDLSNARSRMAVESRMSPLFVHDPAAGDRLPERFSIEGNPDPDKLWTTSTVQYLDESGNVQLMTTPLTPAEFALGEVRFAKHFRRIPNGSAEYDTAIAVPDYIEMSADQRAGHVPFIWATDNDRHLIKVAVTASIIALVEDRKHNWLRYQFLSGLDVKQASAAHAAELAALRAEYEGALVARETSLDDIANAMVSLAMAKGVEPSVGGAMGALGGTSSLRGASASEGRGNPGQSASTGAAPAAPSGAGKPIFLDPADEPRCSDCGTCYQELPDLFEKTTIIVDGEAKVAAHMKPGSLDGLVVTPALEAKFQKVKDNCDSEIIQ